MSSPKSQDSMDCYGTEDYDEDGDNPIETEELDYSREYEEAHKYYSDGEETNEGSDEEHQREFSGIKEQMYQDKLAQLKNQLQQLRDGTHPEYNKKLKKIENTYLERSRLCELWKQLEVDCINKEHHAEKKFAGLEFKEKKAELKENLLIELDEKRKIVEQERYSLDLTGDSMEYKPVSTRKLRRRPNEPPPLVEKRRKPMATSLQILLEDKDVEDDFKQINKSKLVVKKIWVDSKPARSDLPNIDNTVQRKNRFPSTPNPHHHHPLLPQHNHNHQDTNHGTKTENSILTRSGSKGLGR